MYLMQQTEVFIVFIRGKLYQSENKLLYLRVDLIVWYDNYSDKSRVLNFKVSTAEDDTFRWSNKFDALITYRNIGMWFLPNEKIILGKL